MRRPRRGRHQASEHRFSRRRQLRRDLEARGFVEVAVVEDGGRCLHVFVPAPDRRSRAAVVRHVAACLADEAEEAGNATGEEC